ncbi:transposase (fragment) [Mesorhizobium plurifarium]|uniref:Transposase n=1 Tax=Mesorhizobium plurifarium TaxID=69974 RepID=A0A090EW95_MESPL
MKRGKTDAADAEAISEAVTRKTMRFVPIKSADQQAAAMVLRTRALLIRQQTQAINALRGHLSELGVCVTATRARTFFRHFIQRDRCGHMSGLQRGLRPLASMKFAMRGADQSDAL